MSPELIPRAGFLWRIHIMWYLKIDSTLPEKMQHPQGLCSLAPGYNMCILTGCSVSDSFVMVFGGQMAVRRPVFALSVLTLQVVTVVL